MTVTLIIGFVAIGCALATSIASHVQGILLARAIADLDKRLNAIQPGLRASNVIQFPPRYRKAA